MAKEWFELWFDSPYYHILYRKHDDQDAQAAIDNLLGVVDLPAGARVLDLACGKGRHARYLADKGFDVTGLDISDASISYARRFEQERLAFYQHDMRRPFRMRYFDAVFNFFTSFGYFDSDRDHLTALVNISKGLRPGGRLLLDFFNSRYVAAHLIPEEEQTIDGIRFTLRRKLENGYVVKSVDFDHAGRHHHFTERVRLLDLADFSDMFKKAGLRITNTFGDYDLQPLSPDGSRRLILIAETAQTNV